MLAEILRRSPLMALVARSAKYSLKTNRGRKRSILINKKKRFVFLCKICILKSALHFPREGLMNPPPPPPCPIPAVSKINGNLQRWEFI